MTVQQLLGVTRTLPYEQVGAFYDSWILVDTWGVDEAELARRVDVLEVLGCLDLDDQLLFPAYQFHADLTVRQDVMELARMLCRNPGERWWTAVWLNTARGEFRNMSAAGWLAAGHDFEAVRSVVELTAKSTLHG